MPEEMQNVGFDIEGEILVVRIDLSKNFGVSASGKSLSIASTKGNRAIAELDDGTEIILGLNVYTKNPEFVKTPKSVSQKSPKSQEAPASRGRPKRQAVTA